MPVVRPGPPYARRRAVAAAAAAGLAILAVLLVRDACSGGPAAPVFRPVVASRFDGVGQPLACGGRLEPDTQGVAHRTLPCGTRVLVRYRGRTVAVRVIDRRPYAAGRDLDLAGATADAVRFDGVHRVGFALGH